MGDPKKRKRKYAYPSHPWKKERIVEEGGLQKEYGLKNKREIWRHIYFLRDLARRAKTLVHAESKQELIERQHLLDVVKTLGLAQDISLEAILGITLRDVLERRLQTQVYKKGLAHSMKQARQFITHRHIRTKGQLLSVPCYLVSVEEAEALEFRESSALASTEHPERSGLVHGRVAAQGAVPPSKGEN